MKDFKNVFFGFVFLIRNIFNITTRHVNNVRVLFKNLGEEILDKRF